MTSSRSKTLPSYNITICSGKSSSPPSNKSASNTLLDPKTSELTYYPSTKLKSRHRSLL